MIPLDASVQGSRLLAAVFALEAIACDIASIANAHLKNGPVTIITFPDEIGQPDPFSCSY
jgi:hypothetical protein